jgi:hypothetical protein
VRKIVEKFEGKVIDVRGDQIDCELVINDHVERGVIPLGEFSAFNIEPRLGLLFNIIFTKYNGKESYEFKIRKTGNTKLHRRLSKEINKLLEQL